MKIGSLFSGGGLGDFGFLAAGMEISWQCEIDDYCQKILALRYPDSKKFTDIKLLRGSDLEKVDIITGGFPCQPFSVAGRQKGKEDNRYLWPEMLRVIKECRPRWVIGENVPGIINLALDEVCANLEAEGFEVWSIVFPSHALGAWHKRDRLWLIAYSGCNGSYRAKEFSGTQKTIRQESQRPIDPFEIVRTGSISTTKRNVADTFSNSERTTQRTKIDGWRPDDQSQDRNSMGSDVGNGGETFRRFWTTEPAVGRVANGIADRVHRLKMLGNGQVPACTYVIGKMILEIEGHCL